jgi:RimJ/RimL family protein N-acetyltransferase
MTELGDDHLRLRSLRLDDLEALTDAIGDAQVGPPQQRDAVRKQLREMIEKSPTLVEDGFVSFGIEVDGRLVGDLQARAPKNNGPRGNCEIGISLFPQSRNHGIGTAAVRLLLDELFNTGWQRIQAGTAVTNKPMRAVLSKLGFTQEGIMRGFAPDDHGNRQDYVLYAILAGDPLARSKLI